MRQSEREKESLIALLPAAGIVEDHMVLVAGSATLPGAPHCSIVLCRHE